MADIFENKTPMTGVASKEVVTAAQGEPQGKNEIFPVALTNNSVVHARSPQIGQKV